MPLCPSTRTLRASAAVAATRAIRRASPDAACWHTHSAKVRVLPNPRPTSSSQTCQSPAGGSWFGRAIAGQEPASASASCATTGLAIDDSSAAVSIDEYGRRSACRIEIPQRRDHRVARLGIGCHRGDQPGDRSGVIGIDQNIVLDIQQRALLQLAGQAPAIPEVLVQPSREERQRIAVPELRSGAKPLVKRPANNPVMIG
jgi:hypothetical protein